MTSGCDLAGVIRLRGLFNVSNRLKMAQVDTYAVCAAPKIPNLIASLFFSTVGGKKAV
jgi:hypothetical protein